MHAMWWIWAPLFLFFVIRPLRRRSYWRYRRWREFPDGQDDRPRQDGPRDDAELRRREEQVELLESRVAELESRLDFTERLLAQRREPPLMGPTPA